MSGSAINTVAGYERSREAVYGARKPAAALTGLDGAMAWAQLKVRTRPLSCGWLLREAERIDREAQALELMTEEALGGRTQEIVGQLVRGEHDAALVRGGLAVSCEQARRVLGERAYVVQLMGAVAMWHGRLIEMATGEGKTLTSALAAPLIAWRHRRVHVVTVNDYLAGRDAVRHAKLFGRWGLSCAAVSEEMSPDERRGVYGKQIVYGTPKRIAADWLQDALQLGGVRSAWEASRGAAGALLAPGRRAAIVDEADAVLIDEAVAPLILSEPGGLDAMGGLYREADEIAQKLDAGPDYKIEQDRRRARLTARGRHRSAGLAVPLAHSLWKSERRRHELVERALEAQACFIRGRQYEVIDGRVVIVDEFTGRLLPDRTWQHGVHQAVEAKEGLAITADRVSLGQISFQRFFQGYPFLAGMTGTVAESAHEMERVYGRAVVRVPTHRRVARVQWKTCVFGSQQEKERAIVEEVRMVHGKGRPVLIGTRSVEASERIASILRDEGMACAVLNAMNDHDEARLIGCAGESGAITVATNMAGRGTDIQLDDAARDAGGLHVVLVEPHGVKRIDRQFLGRAGRQGDPGSGRIFLGLNDELVRDHGHGVARVLLLVVRAFPGGLGAGALLVGLAHRRAEREGRRSRRGVVRQDEWADRYLPG